MWPDGGGVDCGEGACPEFMTCVLPQDGPWCLPDVDGDGIPDDGDNCPWLANPGQADADQDDVGDACDLCPEPNHLSPCGNFCCADEDGDGIAGSLRDGWWPGGDDNCPILPNAGQADADGDLVGDACDLCPEDQNPLSPCGDACLDSDGDGISDMGHCDGEEDDACPGTPSAGSGDYDGDQTPDVCDPDGVPPIASREFKRRAVLERLRREGVLDPQTVRTALS